MDHLDEYFAKIQKDIEKSEKKREKEQENATQKEEEEVITQQEVDKMVKDGHVTIEDLNLSFEDMSLLDGRLKMKFPKDYFTYHYDEASKITIYRNAVTDTNFFINFVAEVKSINMKEIKANVEKGMTQSEQATKWIEEGSIRIQENAAQYCACMHPAPEDSIFNFMIFITMKDGFAAMNLNGSYSQFPKWSLIVKAMIKTMVIN